MLGRKGLCCPHRKSGNPVTTNGGYPGKYTASLPRIRPEAGNIWPPLYGSVTLMNH